MLFLKEIQLASKNTVEDETEDMNKNEDEDNIDITIDVRKQRRAISCYSHKMDWSNTRVTKAATSYPNFIVLTDNGKVK